MDKNDPFTNRFSLARIESLNNSIKLMETIAEKCLNPQHYKLSKQATKRLRWMYIIYYPCRGNITKASLRIGISRTWLSILRTKFETHLKDPRSLEPESRIPWHRTTRIRISEKIEDSIVSVREDYGWGKDTISGYLKNTKNILVSSSTVNRYLNKHHFINPLISWKNKQAYERKKQKEEENKSNRIINQNRITHFRPPTCLKDYLPGALVEKDMKLVAKLEAQEEMVGNHREYFFYQHTLLDSFTRLRILDLVKNSSSLSSMKSYLENKDFFPFEIATINTDGGGENEKHFSDQLNDDHVLQFYSRLGTPTDNPRVERSHLTDEKEFYQRKGLAKNFNEQKKMLKDWQYVYNFIRPNQALGYLTPMQFYQVWQNDPDRAYAIKDQYQIYLKKQRKRLANTRKITNQEKIKKVVQFVEEKLNVKHQENASKTKIIYQQFQLLKC